MTAWGLALERIVRPDSVYPADSHFVHKYGSCRPGKNSRAKMNLIYINSLHVVALPKWFDSHLSPLRMSNESCVEQQLDNQLAEYVKAHHDPFPV
jgi:hypothetical protein